MLIFTSGTSGEPKAVRCTHGKIAVPGRMLADRFGLGPADTVYVSMPMFHSNAVMAGWAVGLAAGAAIALRRRFSASGFLPDVRAFGATYANYVGKPLSYVLATPERPDDADNPLRIAYGNEGAPGDLAAFAERFGCRVVDGFGSTEGGVAVSRTPDTPPGALGKLADGVAVLDPRTGRPCPPAVFGPGGELLNPGEAVGEFVNTAGAGMFAGYYNDPEADAGRLRDGRYWSGDLGYADARGFCWFAGRAGEWLRVDGENLGTAPVERALRRHPAIAEAAVYGVPDPVAGDQIMACIVLRDGAALTPGSFGAFLAEQGDLGRKQYPRFVRVATELPRTATFKVLTRVLAAERWNTGDPVWWRPDVRSAAFVPLGLPEAAALEAELALGLGLGLLAADAGQEGRPAVGLRDRGRAALPPGRRDHARRHELQAVEEGHDLFGRMDVQGRGRVRGAEGLGHLGLPGPDGDDHVAARRDRPGERARHLPRGGGVEEMQHAGQQHANGLGQVDEPGQLRIGEDGGRVAHVTGHDHHALGLPQQRGGVRDHHRIVVHVRHFGIRGGALGDVVGVQHGGQPGADVDELLDTHIRYVRDGPAEELPVLTRHLRRERIDLEHLLRELPVSGEVVLAAEPVVPHPGNARLIRIKRLHARATQPHNCRSLPVWRLRDVKDLSCRWIGSFRRSIRRSPDIRRPTSWPTRRLPPR
jgi:fatty-acyl-CoA synthase